MIMQSASRDAVLMALLAAALFGAVIPVSRILLSEIGPVTLAGLLYMGAGAGGLLIRIFTDPEGKSEAPVRRSDLPWLFGIIAFGSIIAPILCMVGLTTTPASTASLLLNAELAFTTLIAVIGFREPLGRRGLYAIIAVLMGGLVLSFDPAVSFGLSPGSILIIMACFCWGLDNNCTRVISGKEPARIVMIKGFVAGIWNVSLGYGIGEPAFSLTIIPVVLLTGCLGYGVSILFVIRAMRVLGSARTGALFATAPFIGLILSLPLPGENPGIQIVLSLPLMAAGAWLIITEEHSHYHNHTPFRHEHRHSHDDSHHDHHSDSAMKGVVHAHMHEHEQLQHLHPHTPDLHHFHDHTKNQ